MSSDHYAALGVPADAEPATIRSAYLDLMRTHHPDRRPGDPVSAGTARRANTAFEVLGDPVRRAAYDRLRNPHGATALPTPGVPDEPVAARRARAYSQEYHAFRRDFSATVLRCGLAIFVLGLILLLAFDYR